MTLDELRRHLAAIDHRLSEAQGLLARHLVNMEVREENHFAYAVGVEIFDDVERVRRKIYRLSERPRSVKKQPIRDPRRKARALPAPRTLLGLRRRKRSKARSRRSRDVAFHGGALTRTASRGYVVEYAEPGENKLHRYPPRGGLSFAGAKAVATEMVESGAARAARVREA